MIDADIPTRGRKPLVSHPLLQKEADLDRVLTSMKEKLPNDVRNEIRPHGSRLAHMYGLPKLHKQGVPLRLVLSATGTYNFKLAKWLNSILQPLIPGKHSVDSAFDFVDMLDDVKVQKLWFRLTQSLFSRTFQLARRFKSFWMLFLTRFSSFF